MKRDEGNWLSRAACALAGTRGAVRERKEGCRQCRLNTAGRAVF
jgi:hypothetical protein